MEPVGYVETLDPRNVGPVGMTSSSKGMGQCCASFGQEDGEEGEDDHHRLSPS